jgi:hypothetical protein
MSLADAEVPTYEISRSEAEWRSGQASRSTAKANPFTIGTVPDGSSTPATRGALRKVTSFRSAAVFNVTALLVVGFRSSV